jgi:hypothetical protein
LVCRFALPPDPTQTLLACGRRRPSRRPPSFARQGADGCAQPVSPATFRCRSFAVCLTAVFIVGPCGGARSTAAWTDVTEPKAGAPESRGPLRGSTTLYTLNATATTRKRRGRDSNPRYPKWGTAVFETAVKAAHRRMLASKPERACRQRPRLRAQWTTNSCAGPAASDDCSVRAKQKCARQSIGALAGRPQQVLRCDPGDSSVSRSGALPTSRRPKRLESAA